MRPADFYTGIVPELYASLKSQTWDPTSYASFIHRHGEPALELGCGDGDPLVALRRRGLDVDGIDSSVDMLDRCRRNAVAVGIGVTVWHQPMEALDLPRRYRSIFLAGPTLTLLPDDDAAVRALYGIRIHLEPGGAALVPLSIPAPTPTTELHRPREAWASDGALLRVSTVAEERDESARTQISTLRYERHGEDGNQTITTDRPWVLHWHTPDGFRALAAAAQLEATLVEGPGAPVGGDEFTFVLHRLD